VQTTGAKSPRLLKLDSTSKYRHGNRIAQRDKLAIRERIPHYHETRAGPSRRNPTFGIRAKHAPKPSVMGDLRADGWVPQRTQVANAVKPSGYLRQPLRQPQRRHDGFIRRQQLDRGQLILYAPAQRLSVEPPGFTVVILDDPYIKKHFARWVGMPYANERSRDANADAEFFLKLPCEAYTPLLTRIEFPARELPPARQVRARRPLCNQHTIRRVDHRSGDDMNDRTGIVGAQPLACCKAP